MRILAVTNLYPNPLQPNRATFNRQQFRAMSEEHQVVVISPIAWTDELGARWREGARVPPSRRVLCDGIPVDHPMYIYPPRILRGSYGYFYRRTVRPVFERALTDFGPDVVLASWAYPDGWAAVGLARKAGLPVVVKVHGSDVLTMSAYRGRSGKTIEALRGADAVIAVSKDLACNVEGLGVDPARVHVVYNGVDTDHFAPGPRGQARDALGVARDVPMLLFVGNLVAVKAIDVLIDACENVSRGGVKFLCCLVGEGPLRRSLESRAVAAGLGDVIRFVGSRPHGELPVWFRAATAVVLPSHSEGVPNVLLEACACGTPFVASDVGGVREICDLGAGTLVPAGDAVALAEALRRRLEEPASGPVAVSGRLRSHAASARDVVNVLRGALDLAPGRLAGELVPSFS